MLYQVIFIITMLFLSGMFSGSETALFSLSGFQRKKIQASGSSGAKYISLLLDYPRRTLATILIGNALVNIAAVSVATVLLVGLFGDKGVWMAILIMTAILLIFGELTPKILAIQKSKELSLVLSLPLWIFSKVIWPIRWLLQFVSGVFISIFTKDIRPRPFVTEKELKAAVSISKKEGIIDEEEEEMIRSVFEFGDRSVDEIMTPRVDIVGVSKDADKEELIKIMKKSKFSKIPVYEKDIDHIMGVVYTKQFMLSTQEDWPVYIKKPLYVPEAEMIDDLLMKFQKERNYIAVVIDEFGGTSGIVTLEDVLEEIVGEIRDEFDKEKLEEDIQKCKDGSYLISGKALVKEVNEELGLSLPAKDVNTMNGLLLLLFGRVPKKGEAVQFKGLNFVVADVDMHEKRITKIHFTEKE